MKICILGDFSKGNLDEGNKNIAFNLSKYLSKKHDVLRINTKHIFSPFLWKKIKNFNPNIVHYLTAPTLFSLVILKLIKMYYGKHIKTVASSLHPYSLKLMKNPILRRFINFLKPDLILTQTHESNEFFSKINCETEFLPNGVDTKRFKPVSSKIKEELRKKYEIPKEKFVILHVGHIKKVRGLEIFIKIQKMIRDIQVIIVSSSYFKKDRKIYQKLKESGCIIWDQYFENIEEIYQMSDCYLFPVKKGNSIFIPLSILEAMSCNLPVISTKFEGLNMIFKQGDGLFFAESEEEFYDALRKISRDMNVKTREKVLPYSWENIIKKLEEIYYKISEQ